MKEISLLFLTKISKLQSSHYRNVSKDALGTEAHFGNHWPRLLFIVFMLAYIHRLAFWRNVLSEPSTLKMGGSSSSETFLPGCKVSSHKTVISIVIAMGTSNFSNINGILNEGK
jgi:hypothetical protein